MPTVYYTCSFVATSSAALQELKGKFGEVTSNVPGVPNRKVQYVPDASEDFSKIGFYFLTRN